MADFESTISSILSDPDAMRKIKDLGKTLGLTDSEKEEITEIPKEKSQGFDPNMLTSLLGQKSSSKSGIDFDTISSFSKLVPLMKGFSQDDESTALLNALKPFLSADKRKRLDDANKMLKIMRLLPMLRTQGLF